MKYEVEQYYIGFLLDGQGGGGTKYYLVCGVNKSNP